MSDEELVEIYRNGDGRAADVLMEKYKNLVRKKARSYYLAGADNEDLLQEGMLGLFKAIRDYRADREANFMTFASLCISRHIRSVVTTYNRKKNSPLNTYVSFDELICDEDGTGVRLADTLTDESDSNPERLVIGRESTDNIRTEINNNLSRMEKQVLKLYMEGLSYARIAGILNKSTKSVDNAIQRIRNKISKNY